MQPVNFEGATVIKSNGEENCMHIYAQPVEYPIQWEEVADDGSIETKHGKGILYREYWMPSAKDIDNMVAGRGIVLELHCVRLTPVAMYTIDENGNVEPPQFDETLTPKN